jgi:hypothetical protein
MARVRGAAAGSLHCEFILSAVFMLDPAEKRVLRFSGSPVLRFTDQRRLFCVPSPQRAAYHRPRKSPERRSIWDGDWHLLPASVHLRQLSSSGSGLMDGSLDLLNVYPEPFAVWTACEVLAQLVRFRMRCDRYNSVIKVSGCGGCVWAMLSMLCR